MRFGSQSEIVNQVQNSTFANFDIREFASLREKIWEKIRLSFKEREVGKECREMRVSEDQKDQFLATKLAQNVEKIMRQLPFLADSNSFKRIWNKRFGVDEVQALLEPLQELLVVPKFANRHLLLREPEIKPVENLFTARENGPF